jgi:hypothetical protein
MAFFAPQEGFLAGDNGFFSARKGALRIKPAGVSVMSCVDGFYAEARKNIFLAKKVVKQFFTYFSMTRGRVVTRDFILHTQYQKHVAP